MGGTKTHRPEAAAGAFISEGSRWIQPESVHRGVITEAPSEIRALIRAHWFPLYKAG